MTRLKTALLARTRELDPRDLGTALLAETGELDPLEHVLGWSQRRPAGLPHELHVGLPHERQAGLGEPRTAASISLRTAGLGEPRTLALLYPRTGGLDGPWTVADLRDSWPADSRRSRRTPTPNISGLGRDDERRLPCRGTNKQEQIKTFKNEQNKTRWVGAAYCFGLVFCHGAHSRKKRGTRRLW